MRFADALPEAMAILEADGAVAYWNSAAEAWLGHGRGDLAGRPFGDLLHPDDRAGFETHTSLQVPKAGLAEPAPLRIRRMDGTWAEAEVTLAPMPGGRDGGLIACLRPREATDPSGFRARALGAVLDHTPASVIVTDLSGTVWFVNKGFVEATGLPAEATVGRPVGALVSDRFADDYFATLKESLATGRSFTGRVLVRRQGGGERWEERRIERVPATASRAAGLVCIGHDLTERLRLEGELAAVRERFSLLAVRANDGLWDWDLEAGTVFFSSRFKALLGCEEDELGDSPREWFRWIHPEDVEEFQVKLESHLKSLTPALEVEHRVVHKGSGHRWMLTRGLAVRDEKGRAVRIAGSITDVSSRKLAEAQALHDAFHDGLTGLPNRALFLDRLGQAMARARRNESTRFAVLFLDLDRFKIINDGMGHGAGDQLLVETAQRLSTSLRPADTVARLGGDEYAILLEDILDVTDATSFCDRIQRELRAPFDLDGRDVFTSASIGIALGGPAYERPEELLRDADTAMYRAKGLGRARHAVFDKAMHTSAVALMQLETDLRRAVDKKSFRLVYQPIVSLKTGRTAGFEALVRWMHPQRGIVGPNEFIPLAEETGLIVPIGQWILREAFRQLRAWQGGGDKAPPLMLSVNLSGVQFLRPELITQIDLMLREFGVDARNLKLEITESMILENAEYARDMLLQMKALDIRLCIDDFGTGYSSLSYLRRYPIDTVKIDKSFIGRMDSDPESREIVRTIVTMAHNLGKDVIAEGLETREQVTQVRELACEYAQGYFFSRPVDRDAAEMAIQKRWSW